MPLELNLLPSTIPVTLKGPNGEDTIEIREMLAADRDQHMDLLHARMSYSPDGSVQGITKFDGLQAELLSRSLFRNGKAIDRKEIQSWPSSVVQALYDEAQKLNKLNQDKEQVAKEAAAVKNG